MEVYSYKLLSFFITTTDFLKKWIAIWFMLFGPAPSTFFRAHFNKTSTVLNNSIDLVSTIVHGVIVVVVGGGGYHVAFKPSSVIIHRRLRIPECWIVRLSAEELTSEQPSSARTHSGLNLERVIVLFIPAS